MKTKHQENLEFEHQPEIIAQRLDSPQKKQYISDAVLGAIDGCVTTFAIVAGAIGAGFSSNVALILGFANLFADGFSMAVSNYEANKAQKEYVESVRKMEAEHIQKIPEGEQEEIRQIFQRKGFEGDILEKIVETITRNQNLWIDTMLIEEHGLQLQTQNPIEAALTTFGAFLLVGVIPLIPFFISAITIDQQFMASAILAGIMFFLIGMLKSMVFAKPILISGIQTLITGSAAASLAFITGYILREQFGI
ncbi:VIT1/CCC1 transporter family protein [Thiomicrorhabdus hydrogeniphila]